MMNEPAYVRWMLMQEARALLARLGQVKPFALTESALPAANVSFAAQTAIDRYLISGRQALRVGVQDYMRWLQGLDDRNTHPAEAQYRLSLLRLGFNATLSQFDIFADALTQRSETETGVWLAGLDIVAADALRLENYYTAPPVICYLDRGAGAAIRRARTRLPGGGRYMVPYQEPWMGAVDDMKRLQGWTDVTITHFRELGVYGEQILLSVRYGDWIDINDQDQAKNWARGWRPEIQRYMHAYHAVSGVDLTAETVDARSAEVRYAQPSMLLQKRLAMQQPRNSLSGGSTRRLTNAKSAGFASLAGEAPKRLRINRDND